MADQPAPNFGRTYAGNVQLAVGPYSMHVDLTPVRVSNLDKVAKLTSICPQCEEPHTVSQRYICDNDHLSLPGELHKAVAGDFGLARVTEEEKAVIAETQFPTRELVFDVLPADVVERDFRPDGTAYRARLTSGKGAPRTMTDRYAMIRALAGRPGFRLVGLLKAKENEEPKVFSAEVWQGQLVLQALIRPQHLAPTEQIETPYDEALAESVDKLDQFLATALVAYDADRYRSDKAERHEALVRAKNDDPNGVVVAKPAPAPNVVDILALLDQSLAVTKANKAKPAPRRTRKTEVAA